MTRAAGPLLKALKDLADPESWGGNPLSHDAVLYGHDTPYELARAAIDAYNNALETDSSGQEGEVDSIDGAEGREARAIEAIRDATGGALTTDECEFYARTALAGADAPPSKPSERGKATEFNVVKASRGEPAWRRQDLTSERDAELDTITADKQARLRAVAASTIAAIDDLQAVIAPVIARYYASYDEDPSEPLKAHAWEVAEEAAQAVLQAGWRVPDSRRHDIPHASLDGFLLDKCARVYVERRLESATDLCGYERELLDRLQASRCSKCGGNGSAPYVGGDDDDAPCRACNGSGFA